MQEHTYTPPRQLNPERLDEDLRIALGSVYDSLSTMPWGVVVRLSDGATATHKSTASATVAAHTGEKSRIEKERDAKKKALGTLNNKLSNVVDLTAFNALPPATQIQEIIERIQRIEMVIERLL